MAVGFAVGFFVVGLLPGRAGTSDGFTPSVHTFEGASCAIACASSGERTRMGLKRFSCTPEALR